MRVVRCCHVQFVNACYQQQWCGAATQLVFAVCAMSGCCGVLLCAGSARTDATVQAALQDNPRERKLAEYRARLLNVVKASYGEEGLTCWGIAWNRKLPAREAA